MITVLASLHLRPDLTSVAASRRFVEKTLADWRRPSQVGIAILLTSEVVTNAVQHAETPITVRVREVDTGVRIETSDGVDGCRPEPRTAAPTDEHGRGLAIVDALADRWGCDETVGGKTVWFELASP